MGGGRRRLTVHEKRIVGARQQWRCAQCDAMLESTYEVDHVVPLHRGGDDHTDNCHALCRPCHGAKTQREEVERLTAAAAQRRRARGRPPLVCMRCDHIVSPYFEHVCQG